MYFLQAFYIPPADCPTAWQIFISHPLGRELNMCINIAGRPNLENGILTVKHQLRKEQKKGDQYYFSPPKDNRARSISLAPSVVLLCQLQKLAQQHYRWRQATHGRKTACLFQSDGRLSILSHGV